MVEQGTPQWLAEKIGTLSSTRAAQVMGTEKVRRTLLDEMVVEIAQAYKKQVSTPRLRQGIDDEPEALAAYRAFIMDTNDTVVINSYIESDFHPFITCSPDALIGRDGGVEIKNLDPKNHFHVVDTGEIDPKYIWQAKWDLMVTRRSWWDVFHYCKSLPPSMRTHRLRLHADPEELVQMRKQAVDFIDILLLKLQEYGLALWHSKTVTS